MRGLKLTGEGDMLNPAVASFTDAWIETFFLVLCLGAKVVASFTDAWIETDMLCAEFEVGTSESHLLQMRGLKLIVVCAI